MTGEVRCVVEIRSELGEGPLWSSEEQLLYWIDCLRPATYRYDPATGENRTLDLPLDSPLGALAFRRGGGYLLALESGIKSVDADGKAPQLLCHPEKGRGENRYNDGKADCAGRFFVGSLNKADRDPTGALYRIEPDGSCREIDGAFVCANGMDWSPDNRVFYFVDSGSRNIYAYDFDAVSGEIDNRRVLVAVPVEEGSPDGLCVDREGFLWVAHWDGWRVSRFDPEGRRERQVRVPVPRPTSLAFGGPELDRLYITSSAADLDGATLQAAPLSGSLFEHEPGVRGMSVPLFAG
ncbi:MAG TPA: SMP-30/gluconolactonase/LRE family protein, partial [Alphaproteobacteria bacterium]|nr:SMP-30/gluconolactonase/LRE family protein [Alphaproteobacteria bacterium]